MEECVGRAENVKTCLELSYNHLEGEEVKLVSYFVVCWVMKIFH